MPHSFTLSIENDLTGTLQKVKSEVMATGGTFLGDTEQGSFEGKTPLGRIRGEYRCVSGDQVRIVITEKPFLVPYAMIENQIRSYFA